MSGKKYLSKRAPRAAPYSHGGTADGVKSPTYTSWHCMLARCYLPKSSGYQNYGGRGILVCERWKNFREFLLDMGERPGKWYTLDRVDLDGNYEPGNCRWATRREQDRNKTASRILRFRGEIILLQDLAERVGIPPATLHSRLARGWDLERAVAEGSTGKYPAMDRVRRSLSLAVTERDEALTELTAMRVQVAKLTERAVAAEAKLKELSHDVFDDDGMLAEHKALQVQVAKLREALEWYANPVQWTQHGDALADKGRTAQKSLASVQAPSETKEKA